MRKLAKITHCASKENNCYFDYSDQTDCDLYLLSLELVMPLKLVENLSNI